jgi:signal transduction histidine kinase
MAPGTRAPTWLSTASGEHRVVSMLRIVLGAASLAAVRIDPPDPVRSLSALYTVLALYVLYGLGLYAAAVLSSAWRRVSNPWLHWLEIGWYLPMVALSGGSTSLFFMLFFFPILVAAFRSGFAAGMSAALLSALAFALGSFWAARAGEGIELNRLLLRPVYLLVLGYAISSRGGFERLLRQRMALLKEIGRLSNPRLGTDRTIGLSLERLREFYDADDCLLLIGDSGGPRLRRATRDDPERARREDPLPEELARRLLGIPQEHAIVHRSGRHLPGSRADHQYDVSRDALVPTDRAALDPLISWFSPSSFVTVPVLGRGRVIGRLYVACAHERLGLAEVEFLLQVVDCLLPLLENIRLIDRLAATAAEEERRKIARDVHDSVIQPYVGLRIGLAALQQQLGGAGPAGESRDPAALLRASAEGITRLLAVTESGISQLRHFVARLKDDGPPGPGYAAIVGGFARRFSDLTGIAVEVEAEGVDELEGNDRLAAEVFQLLAEALSNVRRHSEAKRVQIRIAQRSDALSLSVENDGTPEGLTQPFLPRSIADRAESLQGWTRVALLPERRTLVTVSIPL